MSARVMVAVLALALAAGPARGEPSVPPDGDPARVRFQRGLALYKAGLYDAAQEEFQLGYALRPLPLFLFNAAQAARKGNHARKALALYRKFLDQDPQAAQHVEAEQFIVELEPLAQAEPPEPPMQPGVARPVAIARAPVRWYRDRLGGILAGTGAAATLAGAVVLGVGGARFSDAQSSYDSFDAAHQATPLVVAGGVTLGLGVALLAAAGIRYALIARRARVQVTAGAAPGRLGFALGVRF